MATNTNLYKAKSAKNDEFYTQFTDVSKELLYYEHHFKDKIVLCNCDDPTMSAFWEYFHLNFNMLGLKRLISTHYDKNEPTYKMEYTGCDDNNVEIGVKTSLEGNGDFRNQECLDLLDEADIVVTNPPFSLFREYVAVLMAHAKHFLIIGNMNAVTCKDIFPLIRDNKMWYGASIHSGDRKFYVPDDYPLKAAGCGVDEDGKRYIRVKGVRWYTNLDYPARHEELKLWKIYNDSDFPKYDNYDAINVNKYSEIPVDYDGIMGVPITYLDKHNPDQFDILGISASWDETDVMKRIKLSEIHRHCPIMNGKEIYRRIFIRKKTTKKWMICIVRRKAFDCMAANANLHKAKNAKNDEFYTQLTDVAKELMHYKHHFKDKVVFCNCDDPTWSAFWKYFHLNFEALGLKKLISTHYDKTEPTYKMEYTGGDDNDIDVGVKTPLEGNGDFRNQECIALLDEADIVVTNPPFSLAREYLACLVEHKKKFLIVGDMNWITYKEVFPLLKDNKIWLGNCSVKEFVQPDGTIKKFGNKLWFTNLDHEKRHEKLILWKHYSPEEYPTYDNYDAINVNKVDQIPCDYDGVMGVPITYLDKYNPEQFEILGITLGNTVDYPMSILYENAIQHNKDGTTKGGSKVNTRATLKQTNIPVDTVYYTADNADGYLIAIYPRILIRKKDA